jgi:hypothetical protein
MRTPVVLDVNPNPESLDWEQEWLTRTGLPVIRCCGPEVQGGCPILDNGRCRKSHEADGVIFQLDLDRPEHRRILRKYIRQLYVPIRVVATPEQEKRWAHLLQFVEIFNPPIGPAKLDAFAAEISSTIDQ